MCTIIVYRPVLLIHIPRTSSFLDKQFPSDDKGTVPLTLVFPSQQIGTYRRIRWYLTFM